MAITTEAGLLVRAGRRGSGTAITDLAGTEPWRPRILGSAEGLARVVLVQSRASLLGGDEVAVEVDVDDECGLEILELGATVAHHARGGTPARLSVVVRLGAGARLVWLGEPLIAAAGCDVVRSTRIELTAGARLLLREAIVLGRSGEEPGRVRAHMRITLEGRPVVEETFDTGPEWLLRSGVVAGRAGMIDALTLAGLRDPDPPPGALAAHEPATLWRSLGPPRSGPRNGSGEFGRRWRRLVVDGVGEVQRTPTHEL